MTLNQHPLHGHHARVHAKKLRNNNTQLCSLYDKIFNEYAKINNDKKMDGRKVRRFQKPFQNTRNACKRRYAQIYTVIYDSKMQLNSL